MSDHTKLLRILADIRDIYDECIQTWGKVHGKDTATEMLVEMECEQKLIRLATAYNAIYDCGGSTALMPVDKLKAIFDKHAKERLEKDK